MDCREEIKEILFLPNLEERPLSEYAGMTSMTVDHSSTFLKNKTAKDALNRQTNWAEGRVVRGSRPSAKPIF
jgi:hypothetical protein